jgi:hypothetical protein
MGQSVHDRRIAMRSTAGCLMIALLIVTSIAWADSRETSGGQGIGIGVRGHWVIQVADPDGTVVAEREFHNALTALGQNVLAHLLAGSRSAGGFAIHLGSLVGQTSPCAPVDIVCGVAEPRFPAPPIASLSRNLTKTVTSSPVSIVLRGSVQVLGPGQIGYVAAVLNSCHTTPATPVGPSTIAPASCGPAGPTFVQALTLATLATPVSVVGGQTVMASVTLSFASAPAAAPASR